MKKRIRIYSSILLLANIFLFAHSFIPHEHNHIIRESIERFSCHCSSCSSTEISPNTNDEKGSCGCCSKGGKGCFISNGYLSQQSEELSDLSLYYIAPEVIIFTPCENYSIFSYKETITSPPVKTVVSGIGMRAPPKLFS